MTSFAEIGSRTTYVNLSSPFSMLESSLSKSLTAPDPLKALQHLTQICVDPLCADRIFTCGGGMVYAIERSSIDANASNSKRAGSGGGGGGEGESVVITAIAGSAPKPPPPPVPGARNRSQPPPCVDDRGSFAQFSPLLCGIAITNDARTLYVSDTANCRLRQISDFRVNPNAAVGSDRTATAVCGGLVKTVAGDGSQTNVNANRLRSSINKPATIAVAYPPPLPTVNAPPAGPVLYILATDSIRRFTVTSGELDTVTLYPKSFGFDPAGLAVFPPTSPVAGILLVADPGSRGIWAVDPDSGRCNRIAGAPPVSFFSQPWGVTSPLTAIESSDGLALSQARFIRPQALAISPNEQFVWICDTAIKSERDATDSYGAGRLLRFTLPPLHQILYPDAR